MDGRRLVALTHRLRAEAGLELGVELLASACLTAAGIALQLDPQANMAFAEVDTALADRLEAAGLLFYRMGPRTIRLVTSFQTTAADVDDVLARVRSALVA